MNIMDMFKQAVGGTPAPAPATQTTAPTGVANPGQPLPGTASSGQTAPNGMVPAGSANPPAESPFDAFKDLWSNKDTVDVNKPLQVFKDLKPETLLESAKKIDFSQVVTADQLSAIGKGGDDAVKAFAQAMNAVAQTVYAQSTFAAAKIADQAINKSQESYDARLPTLVKRLSVNEGLQTENPLLSNPALQPVVSALSEQLTRKNPNASSAEIQQMVSSYFSAVGQHFGPKPPEDKSGTKKDEDWAAFLP